MSDEEGPSHPHLPAILLIAGISLLILLLAASSTFN
jgi:hypothetical protein